jgi:glycosyltransferase involved in cell wall biosynthesis
MKKIAIVAGNEVVPWGGAEYCWAAVAERFAKRGVHVSVSVMNWDRPVKQVEHLRSVGCRIFLRPKRTIAGRVWRRLHLRKGYEWTHLRRVAKGADLVVISQSGNVDSLLWMEAARSQRFPYVMISQSGNEQWWPDDDYAERLAVAYEAACAAYFVSEANLALTRRQIVSSLPRGSVIRNPFNVRYEARPAWPGDSAEQLLLGYVASLDIRQKGQELLIQVLERPHWRARNVRVTLAGIGPHERMLRKTVGVLKLPITFAGFVENLEEFWSRHHALVLPSRFEGLPLALVEAMLCGRPAIVTDTAGHRELIRHGVNGFLAKGPTPDLLDEAMNDAWENRHRLRTMGERAASDVRERVPPDPVGDLVHKLDALIS